MPLGAKVQDSNKRRGGNDAQIERNPMARRIDGHNPTTLHIPSLQVLLVIEKPHICVDGVILGNEAQ
jgi:hypothetical protein